jgi:phosphohistidine phosphatase
MLSLILFRHGKSDWDQPFESDHQRPLASRGRQAARCMGRFLNESRQVPDLAVSSSALRARDTLKLASKAGKWACPVRIDGALYDASPDGMLAWLRGLKESPERLLLVGHEPTWSELASGLIGGAQLKVATATMLRIDFEIDNWPQVIFGQGELRWLMPPKVACRIKSLS